MNTDSENIMSGLRLIEDLRESSNLIGPKMF